MQTTATVAESLASGRLVHTWGQAGLRAGPKKPGVTTQILSLRPENYVFAKREPGPLKAQSPKGEYAMQVHRRISQLQFQVFNNGNM